MILTVFFNNLSRSVFLNMLLNRCYRFHHFAYKIIHFPHPLLLILTCLQIEQLGIFSVLFQKFKVRALFDDVPITDDEAVEAFEYLARTEGIIPAIESAHAVAYARKLAPTMGKDQIIVITVSGRGDKDCAAIARYRGEEIYE